MLPVAPSVITRDCAQGVIMLAAIAAMAHTLEASCFCGAVRLRCDVATPPISVSICHCSSCRRLTGAPFLANLMLPADALTLQGRDDTPPPLTSLKTSKHVTRHRCSECHSPIYATLGKERIVVPTSLFAPPLPAAWLPQHHLYYDRRVMDVNDELPKFRTHFGSTAWAGELADPGTATQPPAT